MNAQVAERDIFIGVAAVADYRVAKPNAQKMKKSDQALTLELVPTVDILASRRGAGPIRRSASASRPRATIWSVRRGEAKEKKLPLLAANLAQTAIGAEDNELILFDERRPAPSAARRRSSTQARGCLIMHIAKPRTVERAPIRSSSRPLRP